MIRNEWRPRAVEHISQLELDTIASERRKFRAAPRRAGHTPSASSGCQACGDARAVNVSYNIRVHRIITSQDDQRTEGQAICAHVRRAGSSLFAIVRRRQQETRLITREYLQYTPRHHRISLNLTTSPLSLKTQEFCKGSSQKADSSTRPSGIDKLFAREHHAID